MILDENSPIGFIPAYKKNDETGEWEPSDQPLNFDTAVFNNLKAGLYSKMRYNQDWVIAVDGDEGSGKSVFATQLGAVCAAIVSKKLRRKIEFTTNNITYDSDELIKMCVELPEWTPIMLDETKEIANRKRSMGKKIVKLENFLSESRALHKILIIVLPKIQDLTAYLSEHRIKLLFHFFHKFNKQGNTEKPGYYLLYGKNACKQIAFSIRRGKPNWYPRSQMPMSRSQKYPCVDMGALDQKKLDNIKRYVDDSDPIDAIPSQVVTRIKHEEMARLLRLFECKFDTKKELFEFVGKGLEMHPNSISRIVYGTQT